VCICGGTDVSTVGELSESLVLALETLWASVLGSDKALSNLSGMSKSADKSDTSGQGAVRV
jgi:hypothetical protein